MRARSEATNAPAILFTNEVAGKQPNGCATGKLWAYLRCRSTSHRRRLVKSWQSWGNIQQTFSGLHTRHVRAVSERQRIRLPSDTADWLLSCRPSPARLSAGASAGVWPYTALQRLMQTRHRRRRAVIIVHARRSNLSRESRSSFKQLQNYTRRYVCLQTGVPALPMLPMPGEDLPPLY